MGRENLNSHFSKINRCPPSITWKDAQHHLSIKEVKSKQRYHLTQTNGKPMFIGTQKPPRASRFYSVFMKDSLSSLV